MNKMFDKLGIKTPLQLFEYMKENFKYGYISNGQIYENDSFDEMRKNYNLSLPKELLINKRGVCWDFVEFERLFFDENHFKNKSYVLVGDNGPLHTFLVFEKDNHFYHFEYAWSFYAGEHEFQSLNDLLLTAYNKMGEFRKMNKVSFDNPRIFEYKKINKKLDFERYKLHITTPPSAKIIKLISINEC